MSSNNAVKTAPFGRWDGAKARRPLARTLYFTMKICAISPLKSANIDEILQFISSCNHDLIVLPGNADNHPSYRSVAEVLRPGVCAFVETGSGKGNSVPWFVSSTRQVRMPPQIFASKPTASQLDQLQAIWAERTHQVKDRKFSVAICGEIDAFAKDGSVKAGRSLPYDVLVNPTHTTRGRWNHLGVKLKNLSAGTIVVHVANNDFDHHRVTTQVRIYVNGHVINRQTSGSIAWSECEI